MQTTMGAALTAAMNAPKSTKHMSGWELFHHETDKTDRNAKRATPADIERLKAKGYSVYDNQKEYGGDCYGFQWQHAGTGDFSDWEHDSEASAWAVAMLHEGEQE